MHVACYMNELSERFQSGRWRNELARLVRTTGNCIKTTTKKRLRKIKKEPKTPRKMHVARAKKLNQAGEEHCARSSGCAVQTRKS